MSDEYLTDAEFEERLIRRAICEQGLKSVGAQVCELPMGLFVGADRYDTDDEHVLHLWDAAGLSYDVRWPK